MLDEAPDSIKSELGRYYQDKLPRQDERGRRLLAQAQQGEVRRLSEKVNGFLRERCDLDIAL